MLDFMIVIIRVPTFFKQFLFNVYSEKICISAF